MKKTFTRLNLRTVTTALLFSMITTPFLVPVSPIPAETRAQGLGLHSVTQPSASTSLTDKGANKTAVSGISRLPALPPRDVQ